MQTVDSIVQAAGELFAERGYDCTPIADIAERAGVAAGTIIYHFKRKECLLAEVALRHLRGMHAACQEQAALGRTGLDSILSYVDAFFRYLQEHPAECAAYFRNLPADKLKSARDLAPAIQAAERNLHLLLQCLVALGVNDGSIGSREVAVGARSIQAMLLGGALLILFQNGDAQSLSRDAVRCGDRELVDVAPTGAAAA